MRLRVAAVLAVRMLTSVLSLLRAAPGPLVLGRADCEYRRHGIRLGQILGPLFGCELYGALAPGNPNLAGRLTRDLGRIDGHGEGLDGGIFAAGLVLHRTPTPGAGMRLRFLAGVDPGRAWNLDAYLDDKPVHAKCVEAPAGIKARHRETIDVDLTPHAGKEIRIRLFQRVLIDGKTAGNAYRKDLATK